ncbi:MAG: HAD hydrolase family protein, partial [Clostridia bacterium]|nr:HAD hydrolase family protein [Clostridia bacterium]
AGLGVAMGNAADAVKARVRYVTDTNDQDGMAKAVEKYVL